MQSSPMKWEMEEIEVVLERILDLHDKISDAIHAITRAHFLKSIKTLSQPSLEKKHSRAGEVGEEADEGRSGYVFVKGFMADEDAALAEARSLNAIRSALENFEDQLEFFHSLQSQQEVERDAAIAQVWKSRIVFAMRLAEHQGKNYKVIEEAQAFVGDVQDAARFVPLVNEFEQPRNRPGEDSVTLVKGIPQAFMRMLFSGFELVRNNLSLGMINMGRVLGSAAICAVSLLAFLQLHQVAHKGEVLPLPDQSFYWSSNEKDAFRQDFVSRWNGLHQFDVFSARG